MNQARNFTGVKVFLLALLAACLSAVPGAQAQQTILVDDDGVQCPGALATIQDAVASASTGDTILVCPGTYHGQVNVIGHGFDGLKVIANGTQEQVILKGNHTECDGFHLEDVNNVLIRGFTVRDFGCVATSATVFGVGNNILLLRAHHNRVEFNRVTNSDMMGIYLVNSGDNLVQHNVVDANDPNGAGCGIMVEGAASSNNVLRHNVSSGQPLSGFMIWFAGSGNVLEDNTVNNNGRWGIVSRATNNIRIEGNRANSNRGMWATSPVPRGAGYGIHVFSSTGVTVRANEAHHNAAFDLLWDGSGSNVFSDNHCNRSSPGGLCRP